LIVECVPRIVGHLVASVASGQVGDPNAAAISADDLTATTTARRAMQAATLVDASASTCTSYTPFGALPVGASTAIDTGESPVSLSLAGLGLAGRVGVVAPARW